MQISWIISASGAFGWLVLLLGLPLLWVTVAGFRGETLRAPLIAVALNVGLLLLGLFGTLLGLLTNDLLFAVASPTPEELVKIAFAMTLSLLPLAFAVLLGGPLLVLSLLSCALKVGPLGGQRAPG